MKRLLQWTVAVLLIGSLTLDYDNGFRITSAHAQTAGVLTISWTPPTEYEDDTPLLEQDLDFYSFNCNGSLIKQIDSIIGTATDMVDISALPTGTYTCHLTVTTLEGEESGPSNDISFSIGPRVPKAPAGLRLS